MGNFLKKLSLPKIFSKKQTVFLFLLFLIFVLLLPISSTQAQPQFWSPFAQGGEILLGLALQLTLLIAEGILALGIALLGWIIGWTTSGGLSLTNPANNKIIEIGWTLTRDFANIGFILGLVYIGLATALGIVGFQTKKIFGWLLIMALFINFTPVLCGIVVDASNLVGKFFMEEMANWSTLKDIFSIHGNTLVKMLFGPPSIRPVLIFLSLTAFGFVAGFTLLVFALLLLVRIVAIQILVILSPLAFLAYIFPKTRSYFDTWWSQFLQWSFVGAIGGFFLYLARIALWQVKTTDLYKIATPNDPTGGVLGSLAPFFVVIIFLIIGLYITLQTSAMGANYVIGAAKTVGKKIPKGVGWINEKATRKLRQKTGQALSKAGELMRGVRTAKEARETEAARKAQGLEEEKLHGIKQVGRRAGGWAARGLGYGVEKAGVKIGAQVTEATKTEIDKAAKEAKGKSIDKKLDMLKSVLPSVRIGALEAAAEEEEIEKLEKIKGFGRAGIKKILRTATKVQPASVYKSLRWINPEVTGEIAKEMKLSPGVLKEAGMLFGENDRKQGFDNLAQKLFATATEKKIKSWTDGVAQEAVKSGAVNKFWTGQQVSAAGKQFGAVFFQTFQENMESEKWYQDNNPRLERYLHSFAAQSLGIDLEAKKPPVPTPAPVTYRQPWEEKEEKRRIGKPGRKLKRLEGLKEKLKGAETKEEEARIEKKLRRQTEKMRRGKKERGP